jgi:hypothetical protein
LKKSAVLFLLFAAALQSADAAKMCAINKAFTYDTSFGGNYSAGAHAFTGAGNLDGAATWAIKSTDGAIAVRGRHACVKSDWNGGAGFAGYKPNNLTGQACYCMRTQVNGTENNGNWVYMMDLASVSDCSARCAHYCCWSVANNSQYAQAKYSILFGIPY